METVDKFYYKCITFAVLTAMTEEYALYSGRSLPMFWRNLLPPSSGLTQKSSTKLATLAGGEHSQSPWLFVTWLLLDYTTLHAKRQHSL
jgi:hypothetical protein